MLKYLLKVLVLTSIVGILQSLSLSAQVCTPVVIVEQPDNQNQCQGSNFVLSVRAVTEDRQAISYRWWKDGVPMNVESNEFADDAILYLSNTKHEQSGVYMCQITNLCNESVISTPVLVNILRPTTITDVKGTSEVSLGATAMFSFSTHGIANTPNSKMNIQWYRGTTPLKNDNKIAGVNSSILTIRNISATDLGSDYWVVAEGLCGSDTVRNFTIVEAITPVITIDPVVGVSECSGKTAILNATATMNVAGNLNYQWRANGSPIADGAKYAGAKTMMLTINNLEATDEATKFDVVVTSVDGKTSATSNEAQITVKPLAVLDTKSDDVISVETDKELKVFVNMTSPLTLSYQWYLDDGMGNVNAITGANTNGLTIAAAKATDAGIYMVEVKSECDDQMITVSEVAVTMAAGDVTSIERGSLDLNITPNPTSDNVNVNLEGIEYNVITITNTLGEVLFTTNDKTNLLNIDVNNLALSNGLYFINVIGNNTNRTGRFVVNK